MSEGSRNIFRDVPLRGYLPPSRYGETLKIEILAKRGPTLISFELRTGDTVRVHVQMGTSKDDLESSCRGVIHEQMLDRVIRLWAQSGLEREFQNLDRHLLIFESE